MAKDTVVSAAFLLSNQTKRSFAPDSYDVTTHISGHNVILVSEERTHPGSPWDSGQARMTAFVRKSEILPYDKKIDRFLLR